MKNLKLILRIVFLPILTVGMILIMIVAVGTLTINLKNVPSELAEFFDSYIKG